MILSRRLLSVCLSWRRRSSLICPSASCPAASILLPAWGPSSAPGCAGCWPMAAAGALGVRLEKAGTYRLDGGAELPGWETIRRARRLVAWAAGLGLLVCSAVTLVVGEAIRRV